MVALHCNGGYMANDYIITFKVGPLPAHTNGIPAPSCLIDPMFLEAHFQSREQPKVAKSEIWTVQQLGDKTWISTNTNSMSFYFLLPFNYIPWLQK
jgi:hypothetical protein